MGFKIKRPAGLLTSLQLMKNRQKAGWLKQVDTPISELEEQVIKAIYREYQKRAALQERGFKIDTNKFLNDTIHTFGKKAVVEVFLSDSMIFGIPYWWAVSIGIIFSCIFHFYRNFGILFGGMFITHMIAYIYTKVTAQKKRNEKINYILKGY